MIYLHIKNTNIEGTYKTVKRQFQQSQNHQSYREGVYLGMRGMKGNNGKSNTRVNMEVA